jgi:t-SNARE complex subunit (syntaxin)
VKSDASPEEVKAVINDGSGGQIFSQAVRVAAVKPDFEIITSYSSS